MLDDLYGAYSVIERLQHNGVWYRAVEVEWVYRDRPQPIAPYATLIADYGQLDGPERTYAEQYMDEHFTAAEFDLLRRYMESRYGRDVGMSVIPIPMEVKPEGVGFMATPAWLMVEADQSGKFGWYPLDDPEGRCPSVWWGGTSWGRVREMWRWLRTVAINLDTAATRAIQSRGAHDAHLVEQAEKAGIGIL